ncbi:MAG: hypothetical protein ABIF84_02230 [Patescibacteria group bacterium]
MFKVPIKVKKTSSDTQQTAEDLKVDLRNKEFNQRGKQSLNKWLFLSIFLIIVVIGSGLSWWFFSSKELSLRELGPESPVIFSLINQKNFYQQIAPVYRVLKEKGICGQTAVSQINKYLAQADLDFEQDVLVLFENQTAFILSLANSQNPFPLMIVLQRNQSLSKLEQVLTKIEPWLKKDFNFSIQDYRQTEIFSLKPFSGSGGYFYALIDKYFLISNSQDFLRQTIDKIID